MKSTNLFFSFLRRALFWLLLFTFFSGKDGFSQTVDFSDNECAEHVKYFRYKKAEACAKLTLKQEGIDSAELAETYIVLARVYDEYFDILAADSLFKMAFSVFPKAERKSDQYALLLREAGLAHTYYSNSRKAIHYLLQAEKIWSDRETVSTVLMPLATSYSRLGHEDSARFYLMKAEKIYESQNDFAKAKYYVEFADYYYYQSDYSNAIPLLVNALFHFNKLPDNQAKGEAYELFADAYADAGNYARAILLYKKCLVIYKKLDLPEKSNVMNTIGWYHYQTQQYDSAYFYLKSALDYQSKVAPNSIISSYALGNLGLLFYKLDSLEKAEYYSKEAIILFEEMGFTPGVAEAYNNLGNIYFKQEKIQAAKKLFEKARQLTIKEWYDPIEIMNSEIGLSKIAKLEGKFELALKLLESANMRKDSLSNIQLATKLISDEINNSILIAEAKIHDLELEKAEKNVELQKSQYALMAIVISAFIVLISSIVISVSWKQRQTAIKRQTEILSINQEIIRMISHDFRGPMNNIRVLMELLRSEEMTREEFDEISEVIYNQTCEISLMFETFVGWALSQSDNYAPKTENTDWTDTVDGVVNLLAPLAAIKHIKISVEKDGDHHLNTDRIAAQLVLRNLVSNAIKFSKEGQEIILRIKQQHHVLLTSIVDHGIGMDAERLKRLFDHDLESKDGTHNESGSGLGLKMALKFAELNGGRIDVKSKVNEGSTFTYRLPIAPPSA